MHPRMQSWHSEPEVRMITPLGQSQLAENTSCREPTSQFNKYLANARTNLVSWSTQSNGPFLMAVLNSSARSVPTNGPPPRTGIRLGERSDPEQRGVPALIVL